MEALLVLEDGRVFRGRSFGAAAERGGEVVFNTSMSGYQEVLTDPSYRGQIVVMTAPEIGNTGVNDVDVESKRVQVEGFVVREFSEIASSWRARKDLPQYLRENDIPAISELDTRALTRHLRSGGVMRGLLSALDLDAESLVRKVRALPRLAEIDLVGHVTCSSKSQWRGGGPVAWAGQPARGKRSPFPCRRTPTSRCACRRKASAWLSPSSPPSTTSGFTTCRAARSHGSPSRATTSAPSGRRTASA